MQTKKSNKKLIIVICVLLVLVIAAVAVYFLTRPKTEAGAKTITVDVVQLDGSSKTHTINTDAEFLADALTQDGLVKGSVGDFGLFITEVDGVKADDAKQQWWSVWVDGEMAAVGASDMAISDGDKYELKLAEGYE